eukprot:5478257-Prymnesium_polylepis.1
MRRGAHAARALVAAPCLTLHRYQRLGHRRVCDQRAASRESRSRGVCVHALHVFTEVGHRFCHVFDTSIVRLFPSHASVTLAAAAAATATKPIPPPPEAVDVMTFGARLITRPSA